MVGPSPPAESVFQALPHLEVYPVYEYPGITLSQFIIGERYRNCKIGGSIAYMCTHSKMRVMGTGLISTCIPSQRQFFTTSNVVADINNRTVLL